MMAPASASTAAPVITIGNAAARSCGVRAPASSATALTPARPAVRATALLMPEASPARSSPSAPMTAVVSGATVMPIPRPSSAMPGRNPRQ